MTTRYEFALKGRRHLNMPYHFKGCGLPEVYLLSGVRVERDAEYGELITIDKLPELFIAIAIELISKKGALTGKEMRFLRKRMERTQAELAQELCVDEQTVANYEKGKHKPGPADIALRLLFVAHLVETLDEDRATELRLDAEDLMRASRRRDRPRETGPWRVAAA
jgi:transcriptional regulator with XRE-family HTH domain